MTHTPLTLSIVIISTDKRRLMANLPRVMAAARGIGTEVIVVCQGYDPDVSEIDLTIIRLKFLHSPVMLGSSNARNCGSDNATGEFICFLDDDVHPQPDFFHLALNFLSANPFASGVLGVIKVEGNTSSRLFRKFSRPAATHLTTYWLWRLANGNSGVFRRTGLRFDPRLGIGAHFGAFEDADYLLAISRLGSLGFLPDAVLFHPDMDETETMSVARMCRYARGLGGCFAKNPDAAAGTFLLASVLNNILMFVRPRPYPNTRARLAHLAAAAIKFHAILQWYQDTKRIPKVVVPQVQLNVIPVGSSEPVESTR